MNETDWLTPILVLLAGLAGGVFLALKGSKSTGGHHAERARDREDLLREKEKLVRAIRELQDTTTSPLAGGAAEEMRKLELRAATVLRALEGEGSVPNGPNDEPSQSEGSTTEGNTLHSGLPSWFLKAAVAVGFLAILSVTLMRGTSIRTEDMQITGAAPETSSIAQQGPMPDEGQPGGAVPGIPAALKPKPSERVDRARARVAAEPEDTLAWAELGYALLDAEGWIDAFQTAQTLRGISPESSDARVIEAMVRIPMGQPDLAASLLGEALANQPDHIMALTARGMVRYSSGEMEGAAEDWTRARKVAGPGQGHDELLAMLDSVGGAPSQENTGSPHSTPTASSSAGTEPASDPRSVSGTIRLADGVSLPARGVLFIYARTLGQSAGPPVAVKRLTPRKLPIEFVLGPADQMIPGMPFPTELDISARWDLDGNAMSKESGDLNGAADGVAAGTDTLELILR
jgi:hypothetical protein